MTLSYYKSTNLSTRHSETSTYQWRERGGEGYLRKSYLANKPKNSFIELDEKIES